MTEEHMLTANEFSPEEQELLITLTRNREAFAKLENKEYLTAEDFAKDAGATPDLAEGIDPAHLRQTIMEYRAGKITRKELSYTDIGSAVVSEEEQDAKEIKRMKLKLAAMVLAFTTAGTGIAGAITYHTIKNNPYTNIQVRIEQKQPRSTYEPFVGAIIEKHTTGYHSAAEHTLYARQFLKDASAQGMSDAGAIDLLDLMGQKEYMVDFRNYKQEGVTPEELTAKTLRYIAFVQKNGIDRDSAKLRIINAAQDTGDLDKILEKAMK